MNYPRDLAHHLPYSSVVQLLLLLLRLTTCSADCRDCRFRQHAAHQDALLHITPQAELLRCCPHWPHGL